MYYADSDILTVVLTLITMAAGIYSSVKSGKKKKVELDRRKVRSRATVAETVENFKKAVKKKWEDFIDMGGDLIGKIAEGFKNAKSGFTTAVTEWVTAYLKL